MIKIRVFIAIEIPEAIKDYLIKVQKVIRENSGGGNFIAKENIHLTLRFIGETKDCELNKLKKALDRVALNQEDFEIHLEKLGQFSRGNKGIIWVGVHKSHMLEKLHSDLELALEEEGYSKEGRSFVPHITLGRQIRLTKEFEKIKEEVRIDNRAMLVDKISLMKSTRINNILRYIPVYTKEFD